MYCCEHPIHASASFIAKTHTSDIVTIVIINTYFTPRGDIVVIEKNKDRVKELQEGHGGWKARLVSVS